MSISAVGNSQSTQNYTLGDDWVVFLQGVQGLYAGALSGSLSAAAESVRLQTNRVYALYAVRDRLSTLPNGADDKTKVLGNLASTTALLKGLADLGYNLQTQQRLYVSSETFDAKGERIGSADTHLATPGELTTALGYELVGTDSNGRQTYVHKENEGKSDETVTYVVVNTREGQVTASADTVAALLATIEATAQVEADKLSASFAEIKVLAESLDNCLVTGDEAINQARREEDQASEKRLEERRQQESIDRARNGG